MAAKKKPSRASKARRAKKRVKTSARKVPGRRPPAARLALLRTVSQSELRVRRVGVAYVGNATDLEAARIEQRAAERELAAFSAAEAAREGRPFYNFLAQGDSWFCYTCGFAIIHWLQELYTRDNAYFDNIARSGRTLRQMLSNEFKQALSAGPPNGATWDGILLSGGGNDICGDHRFRDWLKPSDGGGHTADWYITSAFNQELAIQSGIYEEAIALVGKVAPGVRLFAHDYDFAIPDGRCVTGRSPHLRADLHICFAGPWMRPAFEDRGYLEPGDPVPQLTKDIVTAILRRFGRMLSDLEQKYPNQFVLVRTQDTLKPIQDPTLWVNELHPYDGSFKLLADPFYDKLARK